MLSPLDFQTFSQSNRLELFGYRSIILGEKNQASKLYKLLYEIRLLRRALFLLLWFHIIVVAKRSIRHAHVLK